MEKTSGLDSRTLGLLVFASALSVGNIYYNQPLLGQIELSFQVTAAAAGMISMLTQLGYVSGLIFITPLGDVTDKRKIIVGTFFIAGLVLLASSYATNFPFFAVMAFLVGLFSVAVQLIIPYVADLSEPQQRGRNMGLVISSALVGILVSRALSGFVGGHFGWRAVYIMGAAIMITLALLMRATLKKEEPPHKIAYPQLIHSLWTLFYGLKPLRSVAITGALIYAGFTTFWASLAFYLHSDVYNLGAGTAGAFGLIGAGGALASNLAGRYVDRIGARKLVLVSVFAMILSYLVMGIFGSMLLGLVIGVLILDMGAQAASISNQTEIYRLYAHSRTRLNTIYKILYFIGGATGAASSALAWQHFGWWGVCTVGVSFLLLATANHTLVKVKEATGHSKETAN